MTVGSEPARLRPVAYRGRAVVALAALLALFVVGVGSGGSQPPRATISTSLWPAAVALQVLLYLVLAISVAMLAVIVYVLWPQRRRRRKKEDEPVWVYEPPRLYWAAKLLFVLVPLALAAALVAGLLLLPGQAPVPASPLSNSLPPAAGVPPASATLIAAGPVSWLSASWLTAALVAGALAGVAMVLLVSGFGRRDGRAADQQAAPGLTQVLEESLDALRRERDPRRAVIAAYSAMERSLAARGLARRPFEAPREYIARVVRRVATESGEVHRLTDLFELAKFSDHDIDQQMRDAAHQALLAIRQGLGRTP